MKNKTTQDDITINDINLTEMVTKTILEIASQYTADSIRTHAHTLLKNKIDTMILEALGFETKYGKPELRRDGAGLLPSAIKTHCATIAEEWIANQPLHTPSAKTLLEARATFEREFQDQLRRLVRDKAADHAKASVDAIITKQFAKILPPTNIVEADWNTGQVAKVVDDCKIIGVFTITKDETGQIIHNDMVVPSGSPAYLIQLRNNEINVAINTLVRHNVEKVATEYLGEFDSKCTIQWIPIQFFADSDEEKPKPSSRHPTQSVPPIKTVWQESIDFSLSFSHDKQKIFRYMGETDHDFILSKIIEWNRENGYEAA